MNEQVALLGWGSLLWDYNNEFDTRHESWQRRGPILQIEFSRVSTTRNGTLTLVIDPENGSPVPVSWSISRRPTIAQAVEDLKKRENTGINNIGAFSLVDNARGFDKDSVGVIRAWAVDRGLDGVVWTDLRSNFEKRTGKPFSVAAAMRYLKALQGDSRAEAFEYIRRAPAFVQTRLRTAITDELEEDSRKGGKG